MSLMSFKRGSIVSVGEQVYCIGNVIAIDDTQIVYEATTGDAPVALIISNDDISEVQVLTGNDSTDISKYLREVRDLWLYTIDWDAYSVTESRVHAIVLPAKSDREEEKYVIFDPGYISIVSSKAINSCNEESHVFCDRPDMLFARNLLVEAQRKKLDWLGSKCKKAQSSYDRCNNFVRANAEGDTDK